MTPTEMRAKGYYELFGDCYKFLGKADTGRIDWDMIVTEADNLSAKWRPTSLGGLADCFIRDIVQEMEKNF